jgi:hypothetical protein
MDRSVPKGLVSTRYENRPATVCLTADGMDHASSVGLSGEKSESRVVIMP